MAMKLPTKPTIARRVRGTGSVTAVWDVRSRTWRFKARFPDRSGGMIPAGTHATEDEAHAALNALQETAHRGLMPNVVQVLSNLWPPNLPDDTCFDAPEDCGHCSYCKDDE